MSQNNYFNKLKYGHNPSNVDYYKAIDWNSIEDEIDKEVWEKLVAQFWTDTRVPVSNDLDDWRKLSQAERDLIGKVFGGLTLLDTMQSELGFRLFALIFAHLTRKLFLTTSNLWICPRKILLFYLFNFKY